MCQRWAKVRCMTRAASPLHPLRLIQRVHSLPMCSCGADSHRLSLSAARWRVSLCGVHWWCLSCPCGTGEISGRIADHDLSARSLSELALLCSGPRCLYLGFGCRGAAPFAQDIESFGKKGFEFLNRTTLEQHIPVGSWRLLSEIVCVDRFRIDEQYRRRAAAAALPFFRCFGFESERDRTVCVARHAPVVVEYSISKNDALFALHAL